MPEITIYTNDGDCANGVAEINPFTVGDSTDWTLKFNDGNNFYSPSNVTMRVGHTNGLPDGTYNNALKWVDRADNQSTGSIVVSSGVPTLTFDIDPAGGVVGTDGVYILRGPQLDGAITSIDIVNAGSFATEVDYSTQPVLEIDGSRPGSYSVSSTEILSQQYSNSPSGTSFALATGNVTGTSQDLLALQGVSTYFPGVVTGVPLTSTIRISDDFSVSFELVSLFPNNSEEIIFSGQYTIASEQRAVFFVKSYNTFYVSIDNPYKSVYFNNIDFNLINGHEKYDVVLSRSGINWSLSISRNGSVVTSDTSTGITEDFATNRIGWSLNGIIRNIIFNDGNSNIHWYRGYAATFNDWEDLIGGNDGSISGNLETYIGQGSGLRIANTLIISGGSGFSSEPIVILNSAGVEITNSSTTIFPSFRAIGNWAKYEFPFMRDESGNDIIAGTTLSPYSDGSITGTTQYDHSTLVVRPETVATASLVSSGLDWIGTMDPINNYVNSRLSLRNSTQLDLQIRGDNRTLFQGQLTILNKIN